MSGSRPRSEPLDLERLPATTPEDVAALRRARERIVSTEDYLRALRRLPPAPRPRRPTRGEPFRLP